MEETAKHPHRSFYLPFRTQHLDTILTRAAGSDNTPCITAEHSIRRGVYYQLLPGVEAANTRNNSPFGSVLALVADWSYINNRRHPYCLLINMKQSEPLLRRALVSNNKFFNELIMSENLFLA